MTKMELQSIELGRLDLNLYNNLPGLKDLTPEQIKKIAHAVAFDNLKEDFKREIRKTKFNNEWRKRMKQWLSRFESEQTKRVYSANLLYFRDWLGEQSFLDVDYQAADSYVSFLKKAKTKKKKEKLTKNTQLLRIAAVSSFYNSLVRWKIVDTNPFSGARKPKKDLSVKMAEQVPTKKDIMNLEKKALAQIDAKVEGNETNTQRKNDAARRGYAAIRILRETGLRVGALQTLKIDANNHFVAKTKGQQVQGRISPEALKVLTQMGLNPRAPFAKYKPAAFSSWFYRLTDRQFSIHGLRHYFAINEYSQNKDIVRLQRLLGHKSISSTQSYLATLESFIGE